MGWPALLATFFAFALACAVIAYWSLQLLAPRAPIAPANVALEQRALPDLKLAGQLFGITPGEAAAKAPASNIQVVGIVAAGSKGSALLTVDGKPARAFSLGEEVTPARKVVEVRTDAVVVDFNGVRSELPSPARASVAVLTSGVGKSRAPAETAPPVPGGVPGAANAPPPVPAVAPGVVPAPTPIPGAAPGGMPGAPNLPIGAGVGVQGASMAQPPPVPPQMPMATPVPPPAPPPAAMPQVSPQPQGYVPRSQRRSAGSNDE